MCEFKVFIDEERVAEDVVYARQEKGGVVVRDVIGRPQTFQGVEIMEVDVLSTRLVLRRRSNGG